MVVSPNARLFRIAGRLALNDALPGIKHILEAFKGGVVAGLVSGVADHIGAEALTPAMKDVQWLASSDLVVGGGIRLVDDRRDRHAAYGRQAARGLGRSRLSGEKGRVGRRQEQRRNDRQQGRARRQLFGAETQGRAGRDGAEGAGSHRQRGHGVQPREDENGQGDQRGEHRRQQRPE